MFPYSRFGAFNSRLGPNKFLFSRLREFASKALNCLLVFVEKRHLHGANRRNSLFNGKNREFCLHEA